MVKERPLENDERGRVIGLRAPRTRRPENSTSPRVLPLASEVGNLLRCCDLICVRFERCTCVRTWLEFFPMVDSLEEQKRDFTCETVI